MRLWADNAATTITDSPLSNSATTVNLASVSKFPAPSNGDYFIATLTQSSSETSWEEVQVTAISGNQATIVRAQNNTSAAQWVSGSKFELRLTADWPTSIQDFVYSDLLAFAAAHG